MRRFLASALLFVLAVGPSANAYTIASRSQATLRNSIGKSNVGFSYRTVTKTPRVLVQLAKNIGDDEVTSCSNSEKSSVSNTLWKYRSRIAGRFDTLRSAGFYDDDDESNRGLEPQLAFIGRVKDAVAVVGFLYVSWKVVGFLWEYGIRRTSYLPNMLITSKAIEDKADLKALECQKCGATIFLARGRDHLFGQRCSNCGAPGKEAFVNIRKELVEEIDDDYWETGGHGIDFLSRAEKKRLLKEAGGDEEKANELLNQRLLEQLEAEQAEEGINNEAGTETTVVEVKEDADKDTKPAAKGEGKKSAPAKAPPDDTGLDALDMDL